jgi:hypothetical protein
MRPDHWAVVDLIGKGGHIRPVPIPAWVKAALDLRKSGLAAYIAPHDLRRTCAKPCHSKGGELEQIQFLLGHASVQTTERYLGCKQNLGHPVSDLFELRIPVQTQETSPESAAVERSTPVETTPREETECRHGRCIRLFYKRGCQEHFSPYAGGADFLRGIQSLSP